MVGQESLDLFQLHRIDPNVDAAQQFALLRALLDEGKVQAVGLSQVSVKEIIAARQIVTVSTVQNLYNLSDRSSEAVLQYCEGEGIGFIPWFPVASGSLAAAGGALDAVAQETGHSAAQLSLAWLLARSPVMMPIPGTSSLAHLEENCSAANVQMSPDLFERLSTIGS